MLNMRNVKKIMYTVLFIILIYEYIENFIYYLHLKIFSKYFSIVILKYLINLFVIQKV